MSFVKSASLLCEECIKHKIEVQNPNTLKEIALSTILNDKDLREELYEFPTHIKEQVCGDTDLILESLSLFMSSKTLYPAYINSRNSFPFWEFLPATTCLENLVNNDQPDIKYIGVHNLTNLGFIERTGECHRDQKRRRTKK